MSDVVGTRTGAPCTVDSLLATARATDPSACLVRPAAGDPTSAVPVGGVTVAAHEVRPGDLFAALPGTRHHGAEFADAARRRGAVAVLGDRPDPVLPTLLVRDPRAVLGPLAARVHGDPSAALAVHGVTGTNGKTSTVHLLAAGLAAGGRSAARSTTLDRVVPGGSRPATRTTPEAPELQALLAEALAQGASDAAVEVSSHGLALHRVDGTRFATGVFTNLSPDHLDLHGDVEGYYAAKAALFTPERCGAAIVVVDDRFGRRLARETRCPVTTVSATGREADWRVDEVVADATGTAFRLRGPGVDVRAALSLLGAHQAVNAAAATAALAVAGVDPAVALAGMATTSIAGRLERVDAGQPFAAFVDFAHNEGGHDRLLPFLRSLAPAGRVVVVAGLTGERDPAKRRRLGARIARGADVVVVTDESPHSEDPGALREALAAGARAARGARVVVEPDRARALARAVAASGPGDVLVVVGRGADPTRVLAGSSVAFDDRVELRRALGAAV